MSGAPSDVAAARDSDAEARVRACTHFGSHMILEAGAGSGKTTVLVERVLAWCLGPGFERHTRDDAGDDDLSGTAAVVLERVTALTFSEAAAAEMESRVAAALRRASEGEGVVAARARAALAVFERLAIRTIHAFCRRLLSAYPVEAGVHPRFSIDANGAMRSRVVREVLEAGFAQASPGLRRDLGALAERACGPRELERLLRALLAGDSPAASFLEDPLSTPRVRAFWQRTQSWFEALGDAELPTRAAIASSRAIFSQRAPEDARSLSDALDAFRRHWDEATIKAFRKQYQAHEVARLNHLIALDPTGLARLHRVLAPWVDAGERRLRAEGSESFDAILKRSAALLREHPRVCAELRAGSDQLLVDEFQDTDRDQCAILEAWVGGPASEHTPSLFVVGDPKQSIYGWRNADLRAYDAFLARLDVWNAERHRLVVNYRSLPGILDEVERVMRPSMLQRTGLQPRFETLLPAQEARGTRRHAKMSSVEYWVAQDLDAKRVPQKTTSARSIELECTALVGDLWRQREAGLPWREMAILLRSTGELDRYLDALRRTDIPYAVDRDRVYYRRREVLEAKALLRTVLDPNDQVAWVAALRSPRCGVPDAAWEPLFAEAVPDLARRVIAGDGAARTELVAAVRRAALRCRDEGSEPVFDFAASCLDFHDVLAALRRSFHRDPFDRFLARLRSLTLLDLSESARFLGRYRIANLDRFFREFEAHYDRCDGDTGALLFELRRDEAPEPDFEEGRPRGGEEDAVQVMTIHGVKGLDFEVVYLLQVHKKRPPRADDVFEADAQERGTEYVLRAGRDCATLEFDRVKRHRAELADAEMVRTLYVAMTRAKTKLVLSGCLLGPVAKTLRSHADLLAARCASRDAPLRFLGDPVQGRLPMGRRRGAADTMPTGFDPEGFVLGDFAALRRYAKRPYGLAASTVPASGSGPPPLPVADGTGLDPTTGALVGTAIHAVLEHLGTESGAADAFGSDAEEELDTWIRAAIESERGAPAEVDIEGVVAEAQTLLGTFREGPLWSRFCSLGPHVIGREIPFLASPQLQGDEGAVGFGVGAIDLLYRDPDSRALVVADWKSDRVVSDTDIEARAAKYQAQGDAYVRAVADALALDELPRFELWFLRAGCVVSVPPLPATRAKPAHFLRGNSAQVS